MAELYYRDEQDDDLTPGQVDENFRRLNLQKLDINLMSGNSSIIFKDKDGNITAMTIAEESIIGRLPGGNIKGLTGAEIKGLLPATAISDVTGLADALGGKSDTGHGHEIDDVSGLQTALDGKAATSHTHSIANVTGLQDELDSKAALTDLGNKTIVASGLLTLVAGTGVISFASAAGDVVMMTRQTVGDNPCIVYVYTIEAGSGITIKSTDTSDDGVIYYEVKRAIS